jgi:lysozyme family protein
LEVLGTEAASMSDFNEAVQVVLRHEGGFVDSPNDPGGATSYGVSLRWLKSKGLLEQLEEADKTQDEVLVIRELTQTQAMGYYKAFWWDVYKYGNLNAQAVASKVFDTSVNIGPSRSHKFLQSAIGVSQDGVLGSKSFNEANALSPSMLVVKLQTLQAQYYRDLVIQNPKLQEFLKGWLARSYDRN